MNPVKESKRSQARKKEPAVMRLSVSGFKSISREQSIEIRPLTVLAGANNSGKSSMMQPFLLLKQTLEVSYDPGALLLDGPNVKFSSVDQLLSHGSRDAIANILEVKISLEPKMTVAFDFRKELERIDIYRTRFIDDRSIVNLHLGMTPRELLSILPPDIKTFYKKAFRGRQAKPEWSLVRDRCFLDISLLIKSTIPQRPFFFRLEPLSAVDFHLRSLIHLPGLRGTPERSYPVAATGPMFPGIFEKYFASVIVQWQTQKNHEKLAQLSENLEQLGLTWKVTAKPINDTQVELQVGRLAHATRDGTHDVVNIADVGLGVSQVLPALVALHVAEPGQLVYLEQPELHLHPRAQSALAQVLADAANRGVRVIAETHSSLLLLGVQTLVAEGKLDPEKVKLHWFNRDHLGSTKVSSADLDKAGAFGDWPEDFAEVALKEESRYLDAAEARMMRKNGYGGKGLATARH